ncbi:uncharacterized protein LOC135843082 [Planococcus citri]|uniref:uncharacterized protein LOC135843082 n=1 Tax=Planococcus citri TaxID=170843 RepID=UPI0031FA19AA
MRRGLVLTYHTYCHDTGLILKVKQLLISVQRQDFVEYEIQTRMRYYQREGKKLRPVNENNLHQSQLTSGWMRIKLYYRCDDHLRAKLTTFDTEVSVGLNLVKAVLKVFSSMYDDEESRVMERKYLRWCRFCIDKIRSGCLFSSDEEGDSSCLKMVLSDSESEKENDLELLERKVKKLEEEEIKQKRSLSMLNEDFVDVCHQYDKLFENNKKLEKEYGDQVFKCRQQNEEIIELKSLYLINTKIMH